MKLIQTPDGPRWGLTCTQPGCHATYTGGRREPQGRVLAKAITRGWRISSYNLCPLHNKGSKK